MTTIEGTLDRINAQIQEKIVLRGLVDDSLTELQAGRDKLVSFTNDVRMLKHVDVVDDDNDFEHINCRLYMDRVSGCVYTVIISKPNDFKFTVLVNVLQHHHSQDQLVSFAMATPDSPIDQIFEEALVVYCVKVFNL